MRCAEAWPEAGAVRTHRPDGAGLQMLGQASAEAVWFGGGITKEGSEPLAVRKSSLFSRLRPGKPGHQENHITASLPVPPKQKPKS